jgi:hypothetical protein
VLNLLPPHPLYLLLPYRPQYWMPKVDPSNEVGAILHAIVNRVLSNRTGRNIYGNVKYAKTFIQGTVMNVFNGCMPRGGNAVW